MKFNNKNLAFTLSEILITLGIIGVVAAMTLSVLINKYQEKYLQKRFAKAYNTLTVAIQKTYADMGYMAYCGYFHQNNSTYIEECEEFNKRLSENLNVVKKCTTYSEAEKCSSHINGFDKVGGHSNFLGLYENQIHGAPIYFLNDGMMYKDWTAYPFYLVDTNGKKGPNKWGHDIFLLWIARQKLGCYTNFTEPGGIECSERLKNILQ